MQIQKQRGGERELLRWKGGVQGTKHMVCSDSAFSRKLKLQIYLRVVTLAHGCETTLPRIKT